MKMSAYKVVLLSMGAIGFSCLVAIIFFAAVWHTTGNGVSGIFAFLISGFVCIMVCFLVLFLKLPESTQKPVKLILPPDEHKLLIDALYESKQVLHTRVVPLLRCGDHPQLASAMAKIESGFAEIDAALWVRQEVVNIGTVVIQQPFIQTKEGNQA